jgi:hypothetical protein
VVDMIVVALGGIAFIIGVAVAVGIESGSQGAGWRGIAAGRHELTVIGRRLDERADALAAKRRELHEWEDQLIAAAACGSCPACELCRQRGGRSSN